MDQDASGSGSRRTRSQLAPDWSVKDTLILVNEIAAVEADCSNAFSSFQKWKIISENCNALDVPRTLNQCRRKWGSLLDEYNLIKQWESRSRGETYWSLDVERTRKLSLPQNFGKELYEAVDAVVTVQEDKAGTDPDSDPEAQGDADTLDMIAELGSKRSRRWSSAAEEKHPHKMSKESKPLISQKEEKPPHEMSKEDKLLISQKEEKPTQQMNKEENLQINRKEERPREHHEVRKQPHKIPIKEKLQDSNTDEEKTTNVEEETETLAAKLRERAELIHAIVKENLENDAICDGSGDQIHEEDLRTEMARRQANQIIACLGDIVNALNQFCELAHECD